jgi:hypothetical protein
MVNVGMQDLTLDFLVEDMVNRIASGKMTYQEASQELSSRCECGIFNPYRAEKLLMKMISKV